MSAELPGIWEQINQSAAEAWYGNSVRKLTRIETVDGALLILDQITLVMKRNPELREAIFNAYFTENPGFVRTKIFGKEYTFSYKKSMNTEDLTVINDEEELVVHVYNPPQGKQFAYISYKCSDEEDFHRNDVFALQKASGMASEIQSLSEL